MHFEPKSDEYLIKKLFEYDVYLTDNIYEAIYLMRDGRMIDGGFDSGVRTEDHRLIEVAIDGDRYDNDFWDKVHDYYGLVRLVPETKTALIKQDQELTTTQRLILLDTDYRIEQY